MVGPTARVFGRAIVMPNLKPPVTTVAAAGAYRDRILAALPGGDRFEPLMTLYLTDNLPPAQVAEAKASGFVHAVKYYPAGATTNSDSGVTSLDRVYPVLAAMEKHGVVLSLHGEVTAPDVDMFDRERVFVETLLQRIVRDFPGLKVVLEHITTREAAAFVLGQARNVAATITPQHLLYSRNALFAGNYSAAAQLLPADPEARSAPPGAGCRRHLGRPALLPGHGLGAPRAGTSRKTPAGAPAATPRPWRCRSMPRRSRTPARSTAWKDSPAASARISTACRRTPTP